MDMVCASLAFIDGLGGPEMVLIFVIVLVLFGGQKLPEFARGLGKSIREFKKAAAGVEEEFKRALEEDERKATAAKLAAAPADPAATPPEHLDPAGPEAGVHSPVTDDVAAHGDYPPDDVPADETSPTSGHEANAGHDAEALEPEPKILPAAAVPPPAESAPAKLPTPPAAPAAPENPS